MSKDYKAIFAKIKAAEPFKPGAMVTHKDDVGTDDEGKVYEITVEQGVGSKIWLEPYRVCSFEDLVLVSAAVSKYEKLSDTFNKLEVNGETEVSLAYEDSADVLHYQGDADETAIGECIHVVENLVSTARSGIRFQENLIDDMRDQDHLEDYERGDYDFDNYCAGMISENFYDYHDYISCSTEQYDHKRGCTTVTASLTTTVADLLESEYAVNGLDGWRMSFSSPNGNMTIDIQTVKAGVICEVLYTDA